jgi:hypothetical protein
MQRRVEATAGSWSARRLVIDTFFGSAHPTRRAATVFKIKVKTTIKGKNSPSQAMLISMNGC